MNGFRLRAIAAFTGVMTSMPTIALSELPREDKDGTFHIPAQVLPESVLLGNETRAALARKRQGMAASASNPSCGDLLKANAQQIIGMRKCQEEQFLKSPQYARLRELYGVTMVSQTIGGVNTEVFMPKSGIAPENRDRVLINVHGGGFWMGWNILSRIESMPIAATGRIKVISINYRLAPANLFPAASEDVEAVYRELLKTYKPEQIGLYGCSAGGLLAAESIAWFIHKKLPVPGAVGMFCEAAAYGFEGDSGIAYRDLSRWRIQGHPYFRAADVNDPLAFPIRSEEILKKFPPSLLISATRDMGLSSVVNTHSRLIALGNKAELHIWEGLGHGFFGDPDLPESREAYDVIVKFFDRYLSR